MKDNDSQTFGDVTTLFGDVNERLRLLEEEVDEARKLGGALSALLLGAEAGRLERSKGVFVLGVTFKEGLLAGTTTSNKADDTTQYHTRIRLAGPQGRAWSCSCMDKKMRGKTVGPCKHTLALGRVFWERGLAVKVRRLSAALSLN